MMSLRAHFSKNYGEAAVSGLYQGYMDMTYFAVMPASLKAHDLKVAIVFNYDAFRFEAWLAARNRKVQRQWWEAFKDSHWPAYRIVAPTSGIDSIVECDLGDGLDLRDAEALTTRIATAVAAFIGDMEGFVAENQA